jgi:hypothetical protein
VFVPPAFTVAEKVTCAAFELSALKEMITGLIGETIEYLISPLVIPESLTALNW